MHVRSFPFYIYGMTKSWKLNDMLNVTMFGVGVMNGGDRSSLDSPMLQQDALFNIVKNKDTWEPWYGLQDTYENNKGAMDMLQHLFFV